MCGDLSRFFVAYRPRRLDATGAFGILSVDLRRRQDNDIWLDPCW